MPDVELHQVATLQEAADTLKRHAPDARLLAGGTDLLVDLKTNRISVGHLISLRQIDTLRGVTISDAGLRIGALTTVTDLNRSPIVKEHAPALLDAAREMAAPQVRNMATIGGNIASAVPCADLPPILMALHASVVIWSPTGERTVSLDGFITGVRKTGLAETEILAAILIPSPPPRFGAAYTRFALREGNAIAVASVAAGITLADDGTMSDVRIVLGAVAPIPERVIDAEALLNGQAANEDSFAAAGEAALKAADPICDVRGSVEFRREIVGVLTPRALKTAHQRALEA